MFITFVVYANAMLPNYARLFGNLALKCFGSQCCFVAFAFEFSWLDSDEKGQQDFWSLQVWSDIVFVCFSKTWWSRPRPKLSRPIWTTVTVATAASTAVHTWLTMMTSFQRWELLFVTFVAHIQLDLWIVMLFALDSHVCLFSVISRQSRTCLPVQFCVSTTSGEKEISEILSHLDRGNILLNCHFVISGWTWVVVQQRKGCCWPVFMLWLIFTVRIAIPHWAGNM